MNIRKTSLLISCLFFLLIILPAQADEANIEILESEIGGEFAETITASVTAKSDKEIENVEFFFRPVTTRTPVTKRNVAEFEPGTEVEASYTIDQQTSYFPPGTQLEYWWKFTDVDGDTLKTDVESYMHLDDRYEFKSLSNERITLYWYRGADDFGQALFDRANEALDNLETVFGVALEKPVQAFIYNGAEELRRALGPGGNEWTGGVAYSDYGVIAMGVAPKNLQWGLRATTHELTHLVVHQATANPYGDIPRWLDEGLAVYNESPGFLDMQFRPTLEAAIDDDSVMTLQTLSSSFPADAEAANLAYGQSGAVVQFTIDTYGSEAMKDLLEIFSEGAIYDDALEEALGVDTRSLDNAWRESVELPPLENPNEIIIVEEDAPAEDAPEATATSEPTPQAVVEVAPAQVEPTAVPVAEAPVAEADEGGSFLPCLGSALPLFLLGLVALGAGRRRRNSPYT